MFLSNRGICTPWLVVFHVTEAGNVNLCRVANCFRGHKPPIPSQYREAKRRRTPSHSVGRLRHLKTKQRHRKPRFSSLRTSNDTRASTASRLPSENRYLLCRHRSPRVTTGLHQPNKQIPRAIGSSPVTAEKKSRQRRRSGEGVCRRLLHWLPKGVPFACFDMEDTMRNALEDSITKVISVMYNFEVPG